MPTKIFKIEDYPKEALDNFLKSHSEKDLLCKCGEFKRIRLFSSVPRIDYYCGGKKCDVRYGTLRPDHSTHMKKLASSGENSKFSSSLMKRGELKNPKVNSIEFISKKLHNKGIDVSGLSDEELAQLNSKYNSEMQFTTKFIVGAIMRFVKKHGLQEEFGNPTVETLTELPREKLMKMRYRMASWHTFFYCSSRANKKYKREILKNLMHNMRNLTLVKTKSSYETNHIKFFEAEKISWDYEPIRIIWDQERGASYIPDFVFEYAGKKYILETKGFLADDYKQEYLTTRINAGYDYAADNGYAGMIISYKASPKNIEELINQTMKEKY